MGQKKIILVGGGGHCKSVIDVIESENKFEIAGILDVKEKIGMDVSGYKIIGTDEDLEEWNKKGASFHITIGHIKSPELRMKVYEKLKTINAHLPVICSPTAHVSQNASVDEGSVIMHHVLLNAGVKVGKNCIINNKALIEHDSSIGDHCHISTAAVVNGDCRISQGCFVGSNAVVIHGIVIEENCVIGAGSVVLNDAAKNKTLVGNPAR